MGAQKATFSLDEISLRMLQDAATRLGRSRSEILREAIGDFYRRADRMTNAEQERMLEAFERHIPAVPTMSSSEIDAELEELRSIRRLGGRRHAADPVAE